MKPLIKLLFSTALLAYGLSCSGQYQNHLILKKGYKSKLHFLVGDSIRFLSDRSEIPIIGFLQAIGEDFIVVNDEQFPLKEINTLIYRRKSFNFVAAGKLLQVAGPGFLGIAGFNSLLSSQRPIWSLSNLITSGILLGVGIILPKLQQRNFALGNKFYLRIVPSDPKSLK